MIQAPEHSDRPNPESAYRPPAPKPQARPLKPLALLRTLKRNPLECWATPHFEQPIVAGGLPIGHVLLVHEPGAIRRVLLDNAANYRKDRLQRRVLSAGLNDGLLSAEGEQWRLQRRVLAPMFARRTVMDFTPAMMAAAEALIDRWSALGDCATIDAAAEMAMVTLDVVERTIFSDGFGSDAEAIRMAMATYFNTIGKISPLDILGVPDFVPRLSRFRVRSTLNFFESEVDRVISNRRRILAEQPRQAPNDLLTHLLGALDTDSGESLTEAEVRSNILTFIAAGHETTANTLSWALFLLSQSREWRERVEAEVDRELTGSADAGIADRLTETRAVIEETVRLYPPISAISRVALDDDALNGEAVRPGSLIVISPYVLHRHRRLWDRPDVFDPGRFLGNASATVDRFAYLPFGAGPRKCIGSAFALQEATLMLAVIVKNFNFQMRPGHAVWPSLRVTLRPANGLPMIIGKRSPGERSSNDVSHHELAARCMMDS
ncbi:cytochrome P450 [Bradyrhizobium sp.]|uniref:cytochrome P450 n=1 Tax=Bradyrhizobium sp. TaxID=376 RepID=UPI0025BD9CEC|nr:cytochrome P450 [Bradyrhizobium sp.]